MTYKPGNENWTPDDAVAFQIRVICHALLDILPEDGLQAVLNDLGAICVRYRANQSGVLSLNEEDPYENPPIPSRMTKESARLLDSVIRARAIDLEDREQ